MSRPHVDQEVVDGLRAIREGIHLRWNPTAVKVRTQFDVTGNPKDVTYEARWEVWDTDPQGAEYMIMRLQTTDGGFRQPGTWLLETLQMLNPERWGGDLGRMLRECVELPELLREAGTEKDSDDLIETVGNWAQWVETPKSAAGLSRRGKTLLSA